MDVTGAWRRIEDEVVQLTPVGIGYQLFQRIRCHTATPEGSRIRADKETNTEHLHTICLNGFDELAAVHLDGVGTCILCVEHLGHRRTEDVAIEQPDLIAQTCQSDSEIGRNRRFANTALARTDGNDVLHLRQQLANLRARLRFELRLDVHCYVLAAMVLDSGLGSLHRRFQKRVCVSRELQYYANLPVQPSFGGIQGGYCWLVGHHLTFH